MCTLRRPHQWGRTVMERRLLAGGVVSGVEGAQPIDASIMPDIPSVATNLAIVVSAERISKARGSLGRPAAVDT
jgi:hypothetical protein